MDLGLGQRSVGRVEHRPAQVEGVAGELEVEERRLPLLELRGGGQHVVGQAGRLGHGHVDDDERVERLEGLAHAGRVGQRVRRVAALDDHGPVAVGVVGEDLVGDHVARHQPGHDAGAHHRAAGAVVGRCRLDPPHPAEGRHGRRRVLGAGLGEVPGERPDQLLEVADEGGVQAHLHAEVLEDGHAGGLPDQAGGGPHVVLGDAGDGAVARDVDVGQGVDDLVGAGGVLGDPRRGRPGPRRRRRRPGRRCSQASVPGRTCRWMSASSAVSVRRGSTTIIDRAGSRAISFSVRAGPGEAVALPRVLADEDHDLAVLDLAPDVGAEHLGVDPELAGLLLGEGVRPVLAGAERGERGAGVGPAEVVPLPAAAEVEDRVAAVGVAHRAEAGRDLGDGGVPVDLLEGAVGPAAQRPGQPLAEAGHAGRGDRAAAGVLVVVEAQRLLARVALRHRVRLVAADAGEPAAVVAAEPHLDAAVALAEDAGGRVPGGVVGGGRRRWCGRLLGATGRHRPVPPGSSVGRADRNPS